MASAVEAGLDVVALTDHDTIAGWDEATEAAQRLGLSLVRGLEVSCQHDGISIHLLAYLPDPAALGLLQETQRSRESRESRAQRMVEALGADLPITYDEVLAQTQPGTSLGRPHIADALMAKGIVRSRGEAFARYLHHDSPYYMSYYAPDPIRAVELVNQAGGVPVMAHPFAFKRGLVVEDEVIEAMAQAGLAGLEVYHRDHLDPDDPDDAGVDVVRHGLQLAERLGLFVTGSSDYHGTGKVNRLGEHTTDPAVLQQIEERATGVPVVRP
jgi:3',5'-nucleoside bisphosphate phosphatase